MTELLNQAVRAGPPNREILMAKYAIDITDPVPLPELIRRAAAGEEVILTEGGEPVARVVTISGANEAALLAEDSLRDWLRPEEDEAWEHLQR